ncbi:MAG: 16S rRNA (cytosine(967)-C(5))-methyltransferase RsmB [Acinetobacter sp.]|nr:16S rRNA (cytosine(967)-C(5))-methyltransferase RsmB [Acinetobacter sp.]
MTQMPSTSLNIRAKAVQLLLQVQQGQSLAQSLHRALQHIPSQDKALFHELVVGTLRQWFALKALALPLLKKELHNPTVESCLYLGLYQLLCTQIAPHAALSETVDACKQLGYDGLSGVVNAILRRATREQDDFQAILSQAHGLPSWLYKRLKKDWGEQSSDLFQQLKQVAPLTLRINTRQNTVAEYHQALQQHEIAFEPCQYAEAGVRLQQSVQIPQLVGFADGLFSVQDEHAQLCATLLPNLDDKIVIDACAAPGGKTAHLLEKYQPKQLFALDNDAVRLEKVQENLQRLQLDTQSVQCIAADAQQWQSPTLVDCIILDAPCTATGVIRRHPDIRLLRQASDVAQTVALQQQILEHMWQQLKVGGVLLYITCSILKAENEQQMQHFFAQHQDAKERVIDADWGIAQQYGRQLLPQHRGGDGFYYCLIEKIA